MMNRVPGAMPLKSMMKSARSPGAIVSCDSGIAELSSPWSVPICQIGKLPTFDPAVDVSMLMV